MPYRPEDALSREVGIFGVEGENRGIFGGKPRRLKNSRTRFDTHRYSTPEPAHQTTATIEPCSPEVPGAFAAPNVHSVQLIPPLLLGFGEPAGF